MLSEWRLGLYKQEYVQRNVPELVGNALKGRVPSPVLANHPLRWPAIFNLHLVAYYLTP
jgi:hypothetical protein